MKRPLLHGYLTFKSNGPDCQAHSVVPGGVSTTKTMQSQFHETKLKMTFTNLTLAIVLAITSIAPIHVSAAENQQPADVAAIRKLIDDQPTSEELQRATDLVTGLLSKD